MIGVGDLYGDWSNDASMFGVCFGAGQQNLFGNIQMSSNREWILLDAFRDPSKEVSHLFFYVIQGDDVFTDKYGKVLEFVKPGDLMRISYDSNDVHDVDPEK